jgi:hypothetical protein
MLRNVFWILSLFILALYAFFVALGAWNPAQVLPLTIVMVVLIALWIAHAWAQHRLPEDRDPRMTRARERRGF